MAALFKIIQFITESKLSVVKASLSTMLSLGKEQQKDKLASQTMDGKNLMIMRHLESRVYFIENQNSLRSFPLD